MKKTKADPPRLLMYIPATGPVVPNTVGVSNMRMHKKIEVPKKAGLGTIRVMPCPDHPSPSPKVRFELRTFEPSTRTHTVLGMARVCPLCFMVFSVDGSDLLMDRFEEFNLGEDPVELFKSAKGYKPRGNFKKQTP